MSAWLLFYALLVHVLFFLVRSLRPCRAVPGAKLLANSRFTIYSLSTGGNSGLPALIEESRGAENDDISDEVA